MAATLVASGIQHSLNFLTRPPRRPLRRLLVWYALVGGIGTVLSLNVPIIQQAIASGPIPGMTPQAGNRLRSRGRLGCGEVSEYAQGRGRRDVRISCSRNRNGGWRRKTG
jgi:hypothetical protein